MSKSVNVDFVTRQIEVDTDGKEHFISAAMAAKDAEQSMLNAQNAANHAEIQATSVQKYKALWFDSVASMKAEPSLTAGAYVCTAGYYAPNDGGGASYLIRTKAESDVDDGGSLHELSNGLVAELIVENGTVCPEQFGAKGDGVTDDTDAFLKTLKHGNIVLSNKEYLIKYIKIYSETVLLGNNARLLIDGGHDEFNNSNTYGVIANNESDINLFDVNFHFISRCTFAGYFQGNNINVCRCKVTAENTETETDTNNWFFSDISFNNCNKLRFVDNYICGSRGKGIDIAMTDDFIIKGNTIVKTARGAIYVDGSVNGIIQGNSLKYNKLFFNISDGAIDFYGTNTVKNVLVIANNISDYGSGGQELTSTYGGCGIRIKSAERIIVKQNSITINNQSSYCAILIQQRTSVDKGHIISENTIICNEDCYSNFFIRFVTLKTDSLEDLISDCIIEKNKFSNFSTLFNNDVLVFRNSVKNIIVKDNIWGDEGFTVKPILFYDAVVANTNITITNNIFHAINFISFLNINKLLFANNTIVSKGARSIAIRASVYNSNFSNNILQCNRDDANCVYSETKDENNVIISNNVIHNVPLSGSSGV